MAKPMNHKDFIDGVRDTFQMKEANARQIVDWFFDAIENRLVAGGVVSVKNFGTFKTVKRAARMARNPRTGGMVSVPAKRVAVFKSGERLADRVNAE